MDQDSTDNPLYPDDDLDTVDGEQVTAAKPDNQTLLRLLEDGEQVRVALEVFRSSRCVEFWMLWDGT